MDLGLGLPQPGTADGSRKQRRTTEGGREQQRILETLAKLSLSNALQVRVLRSVMIDVVRVKTDSKMVGMIRESTKKFADAHKALSAEERTDCKLGLIHIHAWNAMVGFYQKEIEGDAAASLELKQYMDQYSALGWRAVAKEVKHVQVAKAWDAQYKKLEVSTTHDTPSAKLWDKIKALILKDPACKELPGRAPPGDLERQLQTYLDSQHRE